MDLQVQRALPAPMAQPEFLVLRVLLDRRATKGMWVRRVLKVQLGLLVRLVQRVLLERRVTKEIRVHLGLRVLLVSTARRALQARRVLPVPGLIPHGRS